MSQIWNRLGTILDCPPSSRESHAWVDLLRMHHKLHWTVFLLQEGYCAQLDAAVQDTAMGAPIFLLRRPQTNNIAVM